MKTCSINDCENIILDELNKRGSKRKYCVDCVKAGCYQREGARRSKKWRDNNPEKLSSFGEFLSQLDGVTVKTY